MAKIGIRKIEIAKKGDVSDSFFDQSELVNYPYKKFAKVNFVQESAILTDETIDDDNGTYHVINLDFATRASLDEWKPLIKSYIEIPVIILIESIDGNNYVIGSNKAPAYITVNNTYKKIDTRELFTTCTYKSKYGLVEVLLSKSAIAVPDDMEEHQISIDQNVIKVPWQGGNGVVSVNSTHNWSTLINQQSNIY